MRPIGMFIRRAWEIVVRKEVLYYIDLNKMNGGSGIEEDGLSVECCTKLSDIPSNHLERLKEFKSKETWMIGLTKFFDRGGCFWLAKKDEKVVSQVWTFAGGDKVKSFYAGHPMLPDDAILMAGLTLPEFRGRGYMAATRRLICKKLRDRGVSRVYSAAHIRNKAAQKSQAKTSTRIGVSRHLRFFKWYIVLWCKDS